MPSAEDPVMKAIRRALQPRTPSDGTGRRADKETPSKQIPSRMKVAGSPMVKAAGNKRLQVAGSPSLIRDLPLPGSMGPHPKEQHICEKCGFVISTPGSIVEHVRNCT